MPHERFLLNVESHQPIPVVSPMLEHLAGEPHQEHGRGEQDEDRGEEECALAPRSPDSTVEVAAVHCFSYRSTAFLNAWPADRP